MNQNKYQTILSNENISEGEACQYACPLHIDMPVFYDLMRAGKVEDAYVLLKSANPFPAITGRVCFYPCEHDCIRGRLDAPVAIREIEYFLANRIQQGPNSRPELATYKKNSRVGSRSEAIAIIGSGPAGMAAAWDLAHLGYKVIIYEKRNMVGGMAHLGVPIYKILGNEIEYEFNVLKKLGVEIVTGVEVGKDIRLEQLKANGASATCLAIGADVGKILHLKGEKGDDPIFDATLVLRRVRQGDRDVIGLGNHVLVIGGGNTAIDVARTCRRVGCKNVVVVYRRTLDRMPAHEKEVKAAEQEGVKFQFLSVPVKVALENGRLNGLICKRVDAGALGPGRTGAVETIDGSEFLIKADSVIRAISEEPNLSIFGAEFADAVAEAGLLNKGLENGIETLPGLFAAGDVISGPKSIVAALASGRRAATSIHRYLQAGRVPERPALNIETALDTGVARDIEKLKRQPSHQKIPLQIEGNFDLLSEPFTEQQATQETERCLRCNHSIEIDPKGCILCKCCVDLCPTKCLTMITENNRTIGHHDELDDGETGTAVMLRDELCIRCGMCIKACPENVVYYRRFATNGKAEPL
jgi:NADPH-dependent glutamate synthase beta subunit-like oxidoreductase